MAKRITQERKGRHRAAVLTQAHFDAITAAMRRLADLPDIIEAAELCDVDCAEYKAAREYLTKKLQAILSRFFPSGRPAA